MIRTLGLYDSYSLESLSHPSVMPHGCGFAVAASCATFMAYVVCASSAAPAFYVNGFALALAHWWCAFSHGGHLGDGEIRTTLSPRTIISPSFFWFSIFVVSSVSSKTRFRCWSKPFSLPLRLFPPLRRTSTTLLRFCSRISVVISLILESSRIYISSILELSTFKPYLAWTAFF